MAPHTSTSSMSQGVDIKCMLAMNFLHVASKHGWDHQDAVNKIEIDLKQEVLLFLRPGLPLDTLLKALLNFDVGSRIGEAMVTELTVHAATNAVELFNSNVIAVTSRHLCLPVFA